MTKLHEIQDAENNLGDLKRAYLRRWGWEETCNTPGSLWLWRRDFADEDARRKAWDDEHPKATPSRPYGVITATTDVAISMTSSCLDDQPELADPAHH